MEWIPVGAGVSGSFDMGHTTRDAWCGGAGCSGVAMGLS